MCSHFTNFYAVSVFVGNKKPPISLNIVGLSFVAGVGLPHRLKPISPVSGPIPSGLRLKLGSLPLPP